MAVISNGKWEGGSFFISPDSEPSDGSIEMTISISNNKWSLLNQLLRLAFGMQLDSNEFERFSFQSAKINADRLLVSHSDGEVKQPNSEFSFQVLPNSVNILAPEN